MNALFSWSPVAILGLGAVMAMGVNSQNTMPLRMPLHDAVPTEIDGLTSEDIEISEEEQRIAGMSSYVMRVYAQQDAAEETIDDGASSLGEFSLYVGYYENQTEGRTIHSPKNCLPGAGWEALTSEKAQIATAAGPVTVNRFLLQNGTQMALVLYWYQGRGRIEASEYAVKWDLLRDAALHGRSEEALVRIIVPVTGTEEEAFEFASGIALTAIPAVDAALPI